MELEQLLANGAWLERLAMRLARQTDDAHDAVQDTWVAALRCPPERDRAPRPWLASVIQRLVYRQRRQMRRREDRERQAMAFMPEAAEPTSDLMERVQLHRTLTDLVLELEEPFPIDRPAPVLRGRDRGGHCPGVGRSRRHGSLEVERGAPAPAGAIGRTADRA